MNSAKSFPSDMTRREHILHMIYSLKCSCDVDLNKIVLQIVWSFLDSFGVFDNFEKSMS